MAVHPTHRATGTARAAVALAVLTLLTGCSDDDSPSSVASKAESAAESVRSRAGEALESATAEAGRRFDEVKNGVDAKGEVRLGAPATDGDGRTTVEVTADNTADSTKSFVVQVDFEDPGGGLLDTVVVTVSDVPAGRSGKATARSTHKLSGEVRAQVERALRY